MVFSLRIGAFALDRFARAVALSSAFCHTCLCQMLAPKYSICLEQGAGFALAVALSIGLAL